MTPYVLPSGLTVHGVFNFTVLSEFDDLIVPTIQTVISPGRIHKQAFVTLSKQEIGSLEMKIRDDCSVYSEGFWFKVLSGQHEIRITLTEGSTVLFYFFGYSDWQTTNWNTWSIVDGKRIRTPKLTLLSTIVKLFDLSVSDWKAEVIANQVSVVPQPGVLWFDTVISVRGLFAAMLSRSGLNASYDVADVSFVYGTPDLIFYSDLYTHSPDAAHTHNVGQLYVPVSSTSVPLDYWGSGGTNDIDKKYRTMQALITDLMRNFGVRMVIKYDLVFNRYRIELRQNLRAYSGTQTFTGREKVETQGYVSDLNYGQYAKCTQLKDSSKLAWAANGAIVLTTPPPELSFDLDATIPFNIPESYLWSDTDTNVLLASNTEVESGGVAPNPVIDIRYYDYPGVAYRTTTDSTWTKMEEAIAGYNCFRFSRKDWRRIVHTYKYIKADDGSGLTFAAVDTQKRRSINDGVVTRDYFANKVDVDPDKSELTIEWFQENFS